jgi:predicted MFS family arabinose efflux permease
VTTANPRLRMITLVLAVACGLTVANLYYAQPLLDLIATSFHITQGAATVVVTMTQIGYALALIFVLPLGDLFENRALVTRLLIGTAIALLLGGLSPTYGAFLAASVLIGATSVVAQILVPLAAHLAPPAERGRFVGRVVGGLLLGILLARSVSSFVAAAWGWRTIYFISAVLMVGLAVLLRRALPTRAGNRASSYPRLLGSIVEIARAEPALRRRAFCQATMFGAFSAFWTVIGYELIDGHHLSQAAVGVFALVGAAGAAAAPLGGWLADHGYGRSGSGVAIALASVALVLAALGHHSLIALAVGAVLLDLAVNCHQVMSQHEIYALREDARARINTVYMGSTFIGGAISSAVAGALHSTYGWVGAALFGAALPVLGLIVWSTSLRRRPVETPAAA